MAVVLHDLSEVHLIAVRLPDRLGIRAPSVRADLRTAHGATSEIAGESQGVHAVSLADEVGDDRAARDVEPDINVLIAPLRGVARLDALLFGVDESPGFVALQEVARHRLHEAIVESGAALSDGDPEAHDGVAVGARDALSRPDRSAIHETRRDLGALRHRENRHDKLGTDGTEAASTKAPRAVLVLNRLTPEGRSIKKQFLTERDSLPWCRA
jgi:hypothetical protein